MPLLVILLPLLSVKYLKYVFWYPILYFIIWYIFDGCPLSHITPIDETNTDAGKFLLPLLRKYFDKNITIIQHNYIISFIITLSIVISGYKIILSKRCN